MKIKSFDKIKKCSFSYLKESNETFVIFDTNAFFVPYNSNFDFISKIKNNLKCKFVIFDFVYKELENLIKNNKKNLKKINLFNILLNKHISDFIYIYTNFSKDNVFVDDDLVKLISESLVSQDNNDRSKINNKIIKKEKLDQGNYIKGENFYLFTIDNELKRRVRSDIKIISIRQNKMIFFE